jgi:hypothetical protein
LRFDIPIVPKENPATKRGLSLVPSLHLRGSGVLEIAIAADFIAEIFAGFCADVTKVYELLGARFPITPKGVGKLFVLHETPPAEIILPDSITQRKDRLTTGASLCSELSHFYIGRKKKPHSTRGFFE